MKTNLYPLHWDTVTNYDKLGGLKQNKLVCHSTEGEIQNQHVGRGLVPSVHFKEESVLFLLPSRW